MSDIIVKDSRTIERRNALLGNTDAVKHSIKKNTVINEIREKLLKKRFENTKFIFDK